MAGRSHFHQRRKLVAYLLTWSGDALKSTFGAQIERLERTYRGSKTCSYCRGAAGAARRRVRAAHRRGERQAGNHGGGMVNIRIPWRDATTDPTPMGSVVLIREDDGGGRTIRWSERAAVRFRWWLPREVLAA